MTSSNASSPILTLRRHARWPVPVLLLLSVPVFFYNLGNYGLVNGDEGFYHSVASNMVESGDWLTLQWNGELRVYETFMNSPLQHWIRAVIIKYGGYNYWTMRLLSATCGMLAVLLTFKLARQFMTAAESFLAAVLLMFSYQFVFLHGARTGELDAIITLLFVWLAYSFVRALRENRSFIPHHLGLVALITIKLPVIVMPVMFECAFLLLTPRYRRHAMRWVRTLLWMGPLGMSWHAYQLYDLGWKTSFSVLGLMTDQASGTVTQTAAPAYASWWMGLAARAKYYGRMLLFGGFPYTLFAPLALIGVWRHRASRRTTDFLKIITLAALIVIGFFCAVTRRMPWYVVPSYPFLAILVARFLFRLDRLGRGAIVTGLFAVAGALTLAVGFFPPVTNPFIRRAASIMPKQLLLREIGGLTWPVYLPILALMICVAAVVLRRLSHRLPVRAWPALCILLIVGCGGWRIANGLSFTDYVSPTEEFANEFAARVARGESVEFPFEIPTQRGHWAGVMIYRYFYGDKYEFSTTSEGTAQLSRPLLPSEMSPLPRSELEAAEAPGGSQKSAKAIKRPARTRDGHPRRKRDRARPGGG